MRRPRGDGLGNELALCACARERLAERAWRDGLAASRMGPDLWEKTFAGFDRAQQPTAFAAAQAFTCSPDDRWLALYGVVGCGKSHLLAAIANELIRAGRRPLYWTLPDLLAHLQAGYRDNSFDQRLAAICDADVLLLDEWGVEKLSDDKHEILYRVVNHRLTWRLPTALATNLKPHQFPARFRSRLGDPDRVIAVGMRRRDYRTGEVAE